MTNACFYPSVFLFVIPRLMRPNANLIKLGWTRTMGSLAHPDAEFLMPYGITKHGRA